MRPCLDNQTLLNWVQRSRRSYKFKHHDFAGAIVTNAFQCFALVIISLEIAGKIAPCNMGFTKLAFMQLGRCQSILTGYASGPS